MISLFISKKIISNYRVSLAKPMIICCIVAVSLSIASMVLGLGLIKGFQDTLIHKFRNFSGDYIIKPYQVDNAETLTNGTTLILSDSLINSLNEIKPRINYYPFLEIPVLLQSRNEFKNVLAMGITVPFLQQIKNNLVSGISDTTLKLNEIIISKKIADQLNISNQKSLKLILFENQQGQPKIFYLKIKSIYETYIEEIDKNTVFLNLHFLQHIVGFTHDKKMSGIKVFFQESKNANKEANLQALTESMPLEFEIIPWQQQFQQLLDWLEVQNLNKKVLLIILFIVAFINVITCIFVLITDRLKMIGILTYMGIKSSQMLKIFSMQSFFIWFIGSLGGVIISFILAYIQNNYHILALDPNVYYIKYPVIIIEKSILLYIIIGMLAICFLASILPVWFVTKTKPVELLRRT